MASRRESRTYAAQNDALTEFENFKKKYLLVNKHVTKLNSTLSVRIEELNAQISKLQVENLRLRGANLNLVAQLKRERQGKGRNTYATAVIDTATVEALRQLAIIRDAILAPSTQSSHASPQSIPTPPSSSPTSAPTRITGPVHPTPSTRLAVARAPEFASLAEAAETPYKRRRSSGAGTEDSDSEMEHHARVAAQRSTPGAYRLAPPVHMELEPEVEPKAQKAARRQSGLLVRGATISTVEGGGDDGVEKSPVDNVEEFEQLATRVKSKSSIALSASPKPGKRKLVEDSDDAINLVGIIIDVRNENDPGDKDEVFKSLHARSRVVASGAKLQDVTNSPRRVITQSLKEKEQVVDDDPVPMDYIGTPIIGKTKPPRSRTLIPTPTSGSGRLTPIPGAAEEDPVAGGRERRARKSVNYAEPKLNTKMRKPTPDATSLAPRISIPAGRPRSSTTRDPSPSPSSPMPALLNPIPRFEPTATRSEIASAQSESGSSDAAVTARTARRRRAVPSSWGLEDGEGEDEDADDEYVPQNGGVRRKSAAKVGDRRHSSAV
ncbi:hypothetical protein FRC09_019638 [Ceratobasidium sp. 395]|nr:hypothetical protein FRC09_019638 [Ceratobasidium sp. 395]